ncbi:MAG TPA: YihY/virulence factor BrkB family protein [Verrucomicrobiae bacterium]|jgi:membrane protein|nr:YihY/virulence factor BrkB family protein [Verrucomicrobiae bacterium]
MFKETCDFFTRGIWRLRADRLTAKEAVAIRPLRIFLLSLREFASDQAFYRAAALTFFTLLGLVPLALLVSGLARDHGLQSNLLNLLPSAKTGGLQPFASFLRQAALQTPVKTWTLAGGVLSSLVLLKILGETERSLDRIWGVKNGRPWYYRLHDGFWLLFFGALLLSAAIVLPRYAREIPWPMAWKKILDSRALYYDAALPFAGYVCAWLFFSFLYASLPYAKVRLGPALLAGFFAAILNEAGQAFYAAAQTGLYRASPLYGILAAVPLFLVLVQGTWMLFLYGAEISFACQNECSYEHELECKQASHRLKTVTALMITSHCARRFVELRDLPTAPSLSQELGVPARLVQDVLRMLVRSRVLAAVHVEGSDEFHYQPGRPVEAMTLKDVAEAFDRAGMNSFSVGESPEMEKYQEFVDRLWGSLENAPENLPLRETFGKIPDDGRARFQRKISGPFPAMPQDLADEAV